MSKNKKNATVERKREKIFRIFRLSKIIDLDNVMVEKNL